jgi:hypothetical protein
MPNGEALTRLREIAEASRAGRPISDADQRFHDQMFPRPNLAPEGLGDAGRNLWYSIIGAVAAGNELDERELHSLERACRCADEIALLEAAVDRDGVTVEGSRGQRSPIPR